MSMNRVISFALFFALSGCGVYGGISVHAPGYDCPEYCGSNPLGHFGARAKVTDNALVFVDHISSIPDWEDGYGLNRVGFELKYDLD